MLPLFLLCLLVLSTDAQLTAYPGVNLSFKSTFMQKFLQEIVYSCNKVLPQLQIPPISGSHNSYPTGTFTMSSIDISSASCASATITGYGGNHFNFRLNGVAIQLHGHLDAKQTDFPYVHPTGTAYAKVGGATINIQITLTDLHGGFGFHVTAVTNAAPDLSYSGHDDWFISPLLAILAPLVSTELNSYINTFIQQAIQNVELYLANLPRPYPVPPLAGLYKNGTINWDWSLVGSPTWHQVGTAQYFVLQSLGQWVYADPDTRKFNYSLPFKNEAHSLAYITGYEDIEAMVSYWTLNSFLYDVYMAGATAYVNDSIIPSDFLLKLNTTVLKQLIPQLYAAHPDKLLNVAVEAAYYPSLNGTGGSTVHLSIPTNLAFYILDTNEFCFSVETFLGFDMTVHVGSNPFNSSQWLIQGKLGNTHTTKSRLIHSNIGQINLHKLDTFLYDIALFAPSEINKIIQTGYPFAKNIRVGEFGILNILDIQFSEVPNRRFFGVQMEAAFNQHAGAYFS